MVSESTNLSTGSTNPKIDSVDGVLIIDKPSGWTSHDVVAKIRNLTKVKKVGHTGILDPFATGVLPLTLGKATRLTNYFLASDKKYHGIMRFGFATTTYDVDGDPLGEDVKPELDARRLQDIFAGFVGKIRQTLPPYSAKKVGGIPLYSYARKGIDVTPSTKEITVRSLTLLGVRDCEAEFELSCTAGTYARSLAHDIGAEYGCGAHLVRLRRTRSGEFPIEAAATLEENQQFHDREFFISRILHMRDLLHEIPEIVISDGDKKKIIHGMDLNLLTADWESPEFRLMDESGELIALAKKIQTFTSPLAQPAHWIRIHPHLTFS
ncbi:MAG: tRNA pseudouridine(55) synthase TruB [Acidobacteria bacterium]|nr:tRNA pseudouridine(55) synthase TruB [Acidobacteriota bacterium]